MTDLEKEIIAMIVRERMRIQVIIATLNQLSETTGQNFEDKINTYLDRKLELDKTEAKIKNRKR